MSELCNVNTRACLQEFKDVLTVRTDSLKHHKERRQLFSSGPGADVEATLPLLRPKLPQAGGDAASADAAMQQQPAHSPYAQPAVPSFLQQAQQQQQLTLSAPQDTYLSSRAEALHNVESTIVELGGIFNKLSEMVSQQVGRLRLRVPCLCIAHCSNGRSGLVSQQVVRLRLRVCASPNKHSLRGCCGRWATCACTP